MCGISALLDRSAPESAAAALLEMHAPIRHRGPDGEGVLLVDNQLRSERRDAAQAVSLGGRVLAGLAFRRLKILDLSDAAAQPMASPDGQTSIVFNGEIYNFRTLRRELEALGRRFVSSSDTEVALAAYETWGEACFERLDGMWAIVLLDLRRRRLVASRDRFGIKPLYWAADGPRLLLASEAKQILAARPGRPVARPRLVGMYLRGVRYPCLDESFFEGIESVPPASWCAVSFDGGRDLHPEFHRYWRLADFRCADPPVAYEEAVDRFGSLLASAVASHRVTDVRLGSLLSGGLDSSALTSLLVEQLRAEGKDCPTFSFGLGSAAGALDEFPYAQALVDRERLVNHRASFDADWVRSHMEPAMRTLEEPPTGLAALAQYRIFQACRDHDVTVVLDGEGSDEILAGYPYQHRLLLMDRLRRGRLVDFAHELRAVAAHREQGTLEVVVQDFAGPALRRLARGRPEAPTWIAPAFRSTEGDGERAARRDKGCDPSWLNQDLYFSLTWGNMKIILPYTDKTAMAHSVEARVPYFDRALVEFAFSLPDHYKAGGGQGKRILRDAVRQRLPPAIVERRGRMGFATPDLAFLRGPLKATLRDAVSEGNLLAGNCFVKSEATRFLDDFEAGRHQDFRGVWRMYALASWSRAFGAALP